MYVANDAPNSNAVHHKNSADTDSKDSSDSNKEAVVTTNDTNAYGCDSDTVLTIPTTKRKKADVTRFYRYEVKKHKKMVRILTVVAYVICVSMAAIVLSLYYVFLWDPHMTKYRDVKMSSSECDELIRKVKSDADLLNMATTDIRHRVEQLKEDAEHLVQCAINAKNNNLESNAPSAST